MLSLGKNVAAAWLSMPLLVLLLSGASLAASPNIVLIVADDQGWNNTTLKILRDQVRESLSHRRMGEAVLKTSQDWYNLVSALHVERHFVNRLAVQSTL